MSDLAAALAILQGATITVSRPCSCGATLRFAQTGDLAAAISAAAALVVQHADGKPSEHRATTSAAAAAARRTQERQRWQEALRLREQGATYHAIGRALGVTASRAQKIVTSAHAHQQRETSGS